MKEHKKHIIILIAMFVLANVVYSQENLTLYNMHAIPQSMQINPGIIPMNKAHVGLPGISSNYISMGNTGFAYADLVKRRSDDSLVFTVDNMLSKLSASNYVTTAAQTDILTIGFRAKRNYFSLNIVGKADNYINYPKDFMVMLLKGNTAFLGTEANFNFKQEATAYLEYGLGFAHETNNKKLSYGVKAKILSGIANVQTSQANFTLLTDAKDYSIKANANMSINAASLDTGDISRIFRPEQNILGSNQGFGLDLGFQYKITKRLSVSASALDIGSSIQWNSRAVNYNTKPQGNSFTFNGFDVKTLLGNNGTMQHALDSLSDTIRHLFDLVKTKRMYTTHISTKLYAGINYKLTRNIDAGILFYARALEENWQMAGAFSVNTRLGKTLSTSFSYSINNYNTSNVGFGIAINPGNCQFYAVSDNILPLFNALNAKNTNIRFGMNFTFGKMKNSSLKPGGDEKEAAQAIIDKIQHAKNKILKKERRRIRQLEKD